MPKFRSIVISLSSLGALGVSAWWYNHLKLLSLYPSLPVPHQLLISNRPDVPYSTEKWAQTGMGDAWAIRVPRNALRPSSRSRSNTLETGKAIANSGESESESESQREQDIGLQWNKAFWGSAALRLEGSIWGLVKRILRLGDTEGRGDVDVEKDEVRVGNTLLNGLLFPAEKRYQFGSTRKGDSQQNKDEEDVYLIFAAEGIYRRPSSSSPTQNSDANLNLNVDQSPISSTSSSTPGNTNAISVSSIHKDQISDLSILNRLFIAFHKEYSRILVHLAVKRMGISPNERAQVVNQWPD
uniref:Uncharacterized protein n=1 Tax=Kwoniella dejecticola CBS 10117 TaxID=1296121 RepID=A0A1A5ZU91_9TREE|nr:uncharacterized protein I303_08147 [Kwoniella dejecticola CBS 10117]OBR81377.1 hypothetical protein I303_08147 [Kwoniella dejecticola CBS 10117]